FRNVLAVSAHRRRGTGILRVGNRCVVVIVETRPRITAIGIYLASANAQKAEVGTVKVAAREHQLFMARRNRVSVTEVCVVPQDRTHTEMAARRQDRDYVGSC